MRMQSNGSVWMPVHICLFLFIGLNGQISDYFESSKSRLESEKFLSDLSTHCDEGCFPKLRDFEHVLPYTTTRASFTKEILGRNIPHLIDHKGGYSMTGSDRFYTPPPAGRPADDYRV